MCHIGTSRHISAHLGQVVAAVAREAGVPNGDEYVLSGKGTDELAAELANVRFAEM